MSEEIRTEGELSQEELDAQGGEALPDREAMSLVSLEPQPVHDLELPTLEPDKGPVDY